MPIQKFKTFDDAEKALWNFHPDDNYYRRVAELWDFANKLNPITHPRGIFKFKTIEEANQHREQIELEHAKKFRQERLAKRHEK
jgi:hypothetical protein